MNTHDDRAAILEHVHGLFAAYLRKDRAAIRSGHTADWTGFMPGGGGVVRGIDAYMEAAERVLASLRATRYEFLDSEVAVDGDRATVWYVARDFLDDGSTVLLRSIDLYRREAAGWIQCGSHLAAQPEPRA